MSHCYSVTVDINGKEHEICTLVPGNEDLSKHVHEAETKQTKPRAPSKEEVDRSIDFYMKQHKESQHPKTSNDTELEDMMEY